MTAALLLEKGIQPTAAAAAVLVSLRSSRNNQQMMLLAARTLQTSGFEPRHASHLLL
jgi:hypothetical protein